MTTCKIERVKTSKGGKKFQGQMDFIKNSTRPSKERISTLLKLFSKIKTEGTFPNSFNKAIITLIPKLHKDPIKIK